MQNLIVTSSRGIKLKNLVDSDSTQLIFTPGGKFKDLALKASNLVQSSPVKFVYFVAGLSDITTKLTDQIYFGEIYHRLFSPEIVALW